jgi:hypothetical protein
MDKNDGRIKKGERRSPATEFKPGQHWRKPQAFRDKDWLEREYVQNRRSCGDIAREFGVTDESVIYWLRKHDIPRRSVAEARAVKHWGSPGPANGMYGKRGAQVPNWQGGISPLRQAFYSSGDWKRAARIVGARDKGICRRCGKGPLGRWDSHIHHVIPFGIESCRADPDNLVTLCRECHAFVHSKANVDREFIEEGGE